MDKEHRNIFLVWDYWIDKITKKVYAIYLKGEKMFFMEQNMKDKKKKK